MKYPTVKSIIIAYEKGGYETVKSYLNQTNLKIDPSTWCGMIKKGIDHDYTISTCSEIERIIRNLKITKYVSEEKNRGADSRTVISKRDKDFKG